MQTKLIREGRLCAEDFPKAEFQTPARCLNPLPSAVLVFIFPLPRKKNGGKKDCLFQRVLELILQKRTLKKREKRILCKKLRRFSEFPFLAYYKHDLSLCSELPPLAFMVYFSFYYYKLQSSPTMSFCKPSRL